MAETPRIVTTEEVMFFDTDVGGVVHNIAYLRMIEAARTRLAGNMGMRLAEMAERQEYPVVVRTEIDYRKPAKLGDTIEIHGQLENLGKVRFWMSFEVVRPCDETLLVTCRQQLALVQMPKGRPLRVPEVWSRRFQGTQSADKSQKN